MTLGGKIQAGAGLGGEVPGDMTRTWGGGKLRDGVPLGGDIEG